MPHRRRRSADATESFAHCHSREALLQTSFSDSNIRKIYDAEVISQQDSFAYAEEAMHFLEMNTHVKKHFRAHELARKNIALEQRLANLRGNKVTLYDLSAQQSRTVRRMSTCARRSVLEAGYVNTDSDSSDEEHTEVYDVPKINAYCRMIEEETKILPTPLGVLVPVCECFEKCVLRWLKKICKFTLNLKIRYET